jgi:hypothetical protein
VIAHLPPDNKSVGASTNPTARSVGPVASPTKLKPSSQDKHAPHRTTVQGYGYGQLEGSDIGTEVEESEPKARQSPGAVTPEAEEHRATSEGLDRDDARTHKILMQMFAESRNAEAVDSSHPLDQTIDHNLVDLLEDDERILGNLKEMKEAEYPKLLDIAVIIREFEQLRKKVEHQASEEAVLEEIAGDASPVL